MLKFIKKLGFKKTVFCIVVLLLLISIGVCIHYKNKAYDWQRYAAHQNYAQWQKLQTMAKIGEGDEGTIANYHFSNGVVSTLFRLEPAFEGKTASFLGTVFNSMAYDLAYERVDEEKRAECVALYQEMNHKILEICNWVLSQIESDEQAQINLMNERSSLHKSVEKKIAEFCDEYRTKVDETFGWN